jgi:hypothetical protein
VRTKIQTIRLRTTVGVVSLEVPYGQDPLRGDGGSPMARKGWYFGGWQRHNQATCQILL